MSLSELPWPPLSDRCAASGRPLRAGEPVVSVLVERDGQTVRQDYSSEAWQGPPAGARGWWRCVAGPIAAPPEHRTPGDVLLELFDTWSAAEDQADARYVAAMLLARRRVFRTLEPPEDPAVLTVECPRRGETYQVKIAVPDESRAAEIEAWIDAALHPREAAA